MKGLKISHKDEHSTNLFVEKTLNSYDKSRFFVETKLRKCQLQDLRVRLQFGTQPLSENMGE